ncbi:MAG: DeoR/GlpR transcriptional regulator [Clostridiales bacterium]|nr:DeoR/GlpR transcriptional regulator [Clostridiales bacterium]
MHISRRETVNSYIQSKGQVTIKELEKMFPEVSTMTIRRDLVQREHDGFIVRVRGGAKSIDSLTNIREDAYSSRLTENIEGKTIIAKKAVKYVETGRAIYMDSGTTTMCLANTLPDDKFSIFTSGPNIALEILKHHKPSVTILGGQINRDNVSVSGISALNYIKNINIDIAIMATSGFSLENGFTAGSFSDCELKRAAMGKANKTIMLMDTVKIGKDMPFTFATLEDIDVLICDEELPNEVKTAADKYGVELV